MKLLGLAKIEVNDAELDEQMEVLKDMVWNSESETYEKKPELTLEGDWPSDLEEIPHSDGSDTDGSGASYFDAFGNHVSETEAHRQRRFDRIDYEREQREAEEQEQQEINQLDDDLQEKVRSGKMDLEDAGYEMQKRIDRQEEEDYEAEEEYWKELEKRPTTPKKPAAKKSTNVDELAGSLSAMTVSPSKKDDKFTTRRLKDDKKDIKGKNGAFLRYKQNKRTGELSKVNPNNYTEEGNKVFKSIKEKNSKKGGRKSRRKRKKKTRKKRIGGNFMKIMKEKGYKKMHNIKQPLSWDPKRFTVKRSSISKLPGIKGIGLGYKQQSEKSFNKLLRRGGKRKKRTRKKKKSRRKRKKKRKTRR